MKFPALGCILLLLWGAVPALAADYSVAAGDSLGAVAKKQKVPAPVLTRANPDVDWDHLKVGTRVAVPDAYTVKAKDTLYSLTKAWGVDQSAVVALNALGPGPVLKVGQVLYIPPRPAGPSPTPTTPTAVVPAAPPPPGSAATTGLWPVNRTPKSAGDKLKSVTFATSGEAFRSVSSGTVLYVGEFRGVGRVLLVQNAEKVVFGYGNFEEAAVAFGQTVAKGQVLGTTSPRPAQKLSFFCFKETVSLDPFATKR